VTPDNARKQIMRYLAFVGDDGATMDQVSARLHPGVKGVAPGIAGHLDRLSFTGQAWRRDDGLWLHGDYKPKEPDKFATSDAAAQSAHQAAMESHDSDIARCLAMIRKFGAIGTTAPVIAARTRIHADRVDAALSSLAVERRINGREGRTYRGKAAMIWTERTPDGAIASRIIDVLARHDRAISMAVLTNRIPAYSPQEIAACVDDMVREGKVMAIMPEHDLRYRKRASTNRVWAYRLPPNEKGA
jgi:hypothetical protein